MDLVRKISLTEEQADQINQQLNFEKEEGDGSLRIHRTNDRDNQYEADYKRLKVFAETTVNQIDSYISHTVGYNSLKVDI